MTDLDFHEAWLAAAAITVAVEVAVVLIVAWRERLLAPRRRIVFAAVVANAVTHPAQWYLPYFVFPDALLPENHSLYVAVAVAAAVAVETGAYWLLFARHRLRLAAAFSLSANAASYAAGLLVTAAFG